jgi:murein DD-endopeptidase MepM/ murein hydrolase activator NlpD
MKNFTAFTFIYLFSVFSTLFAQSKPNISVEKIANGSSQIFVENPLPCDISVELNFFEKENVCGMVEKTIIVKAKKKQLISTLSACNKNKKWNWRYKWNYYIGDITSKKHNNSFVYDLPYSSGKSYKVMQGYFGTFSHKDEHALDFDMPEGSEVCAMRGGVVIDTREDSNIGGKDLKFAGDANLVRIMHDDNTIADYFHFKQNGVVVKVGQEVKKGQLIAYSGNTGFSSAPHLHVVVRFPAKSGTKKNTIPI